MPSDDSFRNFVKQQQQRHVDIPNWSTERAEWIYRLHQLHSIVEDYLTEYINDGSIKISYSPISINEEDIGNYDADVININIGDQIIRMIPIGTRIIGSKGRVDVEGSAGRSRIILIDKNVNSPQQAVRVTVSDASSDRREPSSIASPSSPTPIEWVWKIVSRPPIMKFIEFNKENLFDLILEVSNG